MSLANGVQFVSFVILAITMVAAAFGVVLFTNIVYSAFLLGAVFVSMAGMYFLLNADFVAAAQILIYVGAVNVLILFAIMLVNKRQDFPVMANAWIRKSATVVVCLGLFLLLGTMIFATPWAGVSTMPAGTDSSIVRIGEHFFSDFLLPFEVASVFLLMAMVGAIILARRDVIPDQSPAKPLPDNLTLPERSRELVGTTKPSSSN